MDQRQFFLRDILTVIFKRKMLIMFLPVLVFGLVFLGNYVWPPTYESVAKIRLTRGREVSQNDPTVTQAPQEVTMITMSIEDINSEIEIIHSRDLLRRVVKNMDLSRNSAFPYGSQPIHMPYRVAVKTVKTILYGLRIIEIGDETQQAMDTLDKRIIAQPVRDTYVLEVACRMGDPDLARKILDTVIEEYDKLHVEIFSNKASQPFFKVQKERTEKELEIAQNKLQEFRQTRSISLLDIEKELLLEQFSDARRILTQLSESESIIAADGVEASMISSLASETESTVVREMQLRLLELSLELNRVVQSLGPKHPTVESLKEQVSEAQANLIEAIATTKRITVNKMDTIEKRLKELNETKAQLERLQQDVDILSGNFELYAGKLEQSRINDELSIAAISNVKIASHPTLPAGPISPNRLLNLILGLVGGIVLALAMAFFLDYLDHGLKTPEDVEYYLRISPIGAFFNKGNQPLDSREAERLSVLIDARSDTGVSQCTQVTSSWPREGSAAVASALADAYANDPGAQTLLLDLSGEIGQSRAVGSGIADVLLGQADFDSVFGTEDALTVVGRGGQGEYPAYLWGSERMQGLVGQLRERYQHIVFHVGPVQQSQDALKVARHVDSVVIVIKADGTRREVVTRTLEMLGDVRQKIAGAVLTGRTQVIPYAVYRRI